jgi:hypothetical protein
MSAERDSTVETLVLEVADCTEAEALASFDID